MHTALTYKQQAYRKVLLGKIHAAPLYKELYADNRADYQAMLNDNFGRITSADLSIKQLIKLLDYLNGNRRSLLEIISPNQAAYIRQLWQQKARIKTEAALLSFMSSNYGHTPIRLEVISKKHASGVIAALKRM